VGNLLAPELPGFIRDASRTPISGFIDLIANGGFARIAKCDTLKH
jgi:hypothetical protein